MYRRKYSKEFKLKVLAEHEEKGLSFWKLGKNYGIELLMHTVRKALKNTTAIFATSLRNSRRWL